MRPGFCDAGTIQLAPDALPSRYAAAALRGNGRAGQRLSFAVSLVLFDLNL